MANQPWRSRLISALKRQGLPSTYVDRMVEELCDHAADLSQENPSMEAQDNLEARLGSPEQLAAAAKSEFQRRTFAGRHPIMTFVAGPLVVLIGTFVVSILLLGGVYWLIDQVTSGSLSANDAQHTAPAPFEVFLMRSANCVVRFVPFAFAAWLFARLGPRSGRRTWSIAACSIIAATAALFWSVVTPGGVLTQGTWMMGFGWNFGLDQILQAAVPAALSAWMLWRPSASTQCVMIVLR